MQKILCNLTVFFENPFWVAVYEREENGELCVCKVTFGKEPKDYEVLAYLEQHFCALKFSAPVAGKVPAKTIRNPKRMQREIKKAVNAQGIGTKSQQALKQQQEARKKDGVKNARVQKLAQEQERYLLRCKKRKEKHRGR